MSLNPFKPEFIIDIFIHYKALITLSIFGVVDEDDLKWVTRNKFEKYAKTV